MPISSKNCSGFIGPRLLYKENMLENADFEQDITLPPGGVEKDLNKLKESQVLTESQQKRKQLEIGIVQSIPNLLGQMQDLEQKANVMLQDDQGNLTPAVEGQESHERSIQKNDTISKVLFAYGLKDKRLLYSLAIANLARQFKQQKLDINKIYIGDKIKVDLVKEGEGEKGRYKLYIARDDKQLKDDGFDLFSENFYEALQNPSDLNKQEAPVRPKRSANKPRTVRESSKATEYDPQKAVADIQNTLPSGNEGFGSDFSQKVTQLTNDGQDVTDIDVKKMEDGYSVRFWSQGKLRKSVTVFGDNVKINPRDLLKAAKAIQKQQK